MCGIAGVVSSISNDNIGLLLNKMLKTMQHRGPDGAGYAVNHSVKTSLKLEDLKLDREKGNIALGHVRLAITGGITGVQPFQSENKKLILLHNGEIYNYMDLRSALSAQTTFKTDTDSEVILKLVEKHYQGNLVEAVKKILPLLDGVYALAITDNHQTVIARDKIGVRQIYYCSDGKHVAFASEKKPLKAIMEKDVQIQRLLPGHIAVCDGKDINSVPFWEPAQIQATEKISDEDEAIQAYDEALQEAVLKRVRGRDRVGIIFSGGIDSFLIAYLVQKMGVPFTCYTAGREGAEDIQWAKKIAAEYGFILQVKMLSSDDIESLVPEIIRDIEDYSLNQVEVAVPIYASVRMAQEAGERVLLTGQGADELFGGYPWYSRIVDREGYDSFENYSWEDTFLLYKECLEREDKIAMAHSIELRVPFLDPKVIETAFKIAPQLKIIDGDDDFLKIIHREYCLIQSIPKEIAYRKKEAAQHGANVHNTFEELASKTDITRALLSCAGFSEDKSIPEKLGSSSRYGYRYGDRHLWKPLPEVQYYLTSIADELDCLTPDIKKYFHQVKNRLDEISVENGGCQS